MEYGMINSALKDEPFHDNNAGFRIFRNKGGNQKKKHGKLNMYCYGKNGD